MFVRHDSGMYAELRGLSFEPDPSSLPADPSSFVACIRMLIGPLDGAGEESFDITVCTAEWLARAVAAHGGILDVRHHVVVDAATFSQPVLEAWLAKRVSSVSGATWTVVASRLARLGHWEFEDYEA